MVPRMIWPIKMRITVQEEDNSSEDADSQVPSPSQEECIKGGRHKRLKGLRRKTTCRLQRKSPKEFNKTHIARRSHSRVLYFSPRPFVRLWSEPDFYMNILWWHRVIFSSKTIIIFPSGQSPCRPKKTCCCLNDNAWATYYWL
jgi:hypothetical protein